MILIKSIASLVQLVERWSPKPNVEGSSPSGRAYIHIFFLNVNKLEFLKKRANFTKTNT